MNETWLETQLLVPAEAVDLASYILHDLGCQGVVTDERRLDTFIPPDPDEPAIGEQCLRGYFPPGTDPEQLAREILMRLAELGSLFPDWTPQPPVFHSVHQEDWAEGWKQHFSSFQVGRLTVKPTWEESPPDSELVVEIDPGMAFGTGTHATTRLCLEALVGRLDTAHQAPEVLDVGTGSGILAIAAAKLGAVRVVASDIDPEACRIAAENARLNRVAETIEFTTRLLEEIPGRFQVVLANILAEENIRLAPELVAKLLPGGWLVLSGILAEKEVLVKTAFAAYPLSDPEIRRQEEWIALIYRKQT